MVHVHKVMIVSVKHLLLTIVQNTITPKEQIYSNMIKKIAFSTNLFKSVMNNPLK
jgi:hypothetical protein